MKRFAKKFGATYSKTERQLAAYFEIGCFFSIVEFYEQKGFASSLKNLDSKTNSFRYLTTPSGNPNNFSYVEMASEFEEIEIRQQVRICSHVNAEISFTPDIVVIPKDVSIEGRKDKDYAGGKKKFFSVHSQDVIAAHECKSLPPFPELLVSFIGVLIAAHQWYEDDNYEWQENDGLHLAPTLFVGGSARALHLRMIKALMDSYPVNILTGMHDGSWKLINPDAAINTIDIETSVDI